MKDRKGIIAAGNWIIDIVKLLDVYPTQESLANILSESISNGGSPYNVLKNLHKLKSNFPLEAIGLVGYDERGSFIVNECNSLGINTSQLHITTDAPTSYTDVMSVASTGKRTFFHQRGANALLDSSHFDLTKSNAKIFHLGYLMLLDKLDIVSDGDTKAMHIFKQAQHLGFVTSSDMVSDNSDRFNEVVSPSLPYIDILFINEFEAEKITHIATTNNGVIDLIACEKACIELLEKGVNQWVILHCPEIVIAAHKEGKVLYQNSLNIPSTYISSAVGAGDAFASGVLYGVHENYDMEKSLLLGVATAAASLSKPNCSDGVLTVKECLDLVEQFGFRKLAGQML